MTLGIPDVDRWQARRRGLSAVVVWVVLEFAIRGGGLVLGGLALLPGDWNPKANPVPPELWTLNTFVLWPALLVIGAVFLRRARREGLDAASLGYRPSRPQVIAGLLAAVLLVPVDAGTNYLDSVLFHQRWTEEMLFKAVAGAGKIVAALLLLGNGILGPVVEELAWRGYIQRRLVEAWGVRAGIAATALLFAAKHVIVDLSFERTLTLVFGGLALGIIGWRWGTLASTLTHVVGNTAATLGAILQAFLTHGW